MEALIEIDRLIETVVEHLEGVTVRMDAQAGTVHVDQRYHLAVLEQERKNDEIDLRTAIGYRQRPDSADMGETNLDSSVSETGISSGVTSFTSAGFSAPSTFKDHHSQAQKAAECGDKKHGHHCNKHQTNEKKGKSRQPKSKQWSVSSLDSSSLMEVTDSTTMTTGTFLDSVEMCSDCRKCGKAKVKINFAVYSNNALSMPDAGINCLPRKSDKIYEEINKKSLVLVRAIDEADAQRLNRRLNQDRSKLADGISSLTSFGGLKSRR